MHELSQLYTQQSDDPDAPKLTKYLLRGVSTTKDVTYICRRAVPDLIEMDLGDDELKDNPDQWWKIAYVSEGYNARTVVEVCIISSYEISHLTVHRRPPRRQYWKQQRTRVTMFCLYTRVRRLWMRMSTPFHRPSMYVPAFLTYTKLINCQHFVQWDNASFKKEFPASPIEISSSQSPPSKRKFDNSDASSPTRETDRDFRGTSEPARGWDDSAQAAARQLNQRVNAAQEDHMVIGIDPLLLAKEQDHESESTGVEMQERVNAPLLGQMRRKESDNISLETIDHMDMVVEDSQTAEESAAVQHVEFKRQGST